MCYMLHRINVVSFRFGRRPFNYAPLSSTPKTPKYFVLGFSPSNAAAQNGWIFTQHQQQKVCLYLLWRTQLFPGTAFTVMYLVVCVVILNGTHTVKAAEFGYKQVVSASRLSWRMAWFHGFVCLLPAACCMRRRRTYYLQGWFCPNFTLQILFFEGVVLLFHQKQIRY